MGSPLCYGGVLGRQRDNTGEMEAVEYLWVGLGGFAGANARYVVIRAVADRAGAAFPYGTLVVNLVGSLLAGIVVTLLAERLVANPMWRQLVVIGFLGGFTTFSAYSVETIALVKDGRWGAGLAYVVTSNALGLALCGAGVALTRQLIR